MPLVRIDIRKDRPAGLGRRIGEVVYRTMADTINVPANDNFQVITEHETDRLVYDPQYLGIARSAGIVFIQITLNEGRRSSFKKRFYETLAARLHGEPRDAPRGCVREPGRGEEGKLVVRQWRGAVRGVGMAEPAAVTAPRFRQS
ncbi:MAG: tautomerase family protein [Comamonadaceae bacterium]|nr:tautomerase family protein [Comamonadaceae bacterium]